MTIERCNEAFNRHDTDAVMELMTDDTVFENTGGERFEGQEAVRAFFRRAFESMPMGLRQGRGEDRVREVRGGRPEARAS